MEGIHEEDYRGKLSLFISQSTQAECKEMFNILFKKSNGFDQDQ